MVGTNPWYIRMFNFLLGLEGDKAQGMQELSRAAEAGNVDAQFLYKGVLIREQRLPEALSVLEELHGRYPRNISFHLQMAQINAKLGNTDEAEVIFDDILERIATDPSVDKRVTREKVERIIMKVGSL